MKPQFIYGTAWKEEDTERCVYDAVTAGFRAIDTANQRKHYFEAGVGAALKRIFTEGELTRRDIFLQTKFTYLRGQDHRLPYDATADLRLQVKQSFESSLEHLGTDYLDSYVLHGPSHYQDLKVDDWEVWDTMEAYQKEGQVKALGISNVNLEQLQDLYEEAEVKPTYVQNRCFARTGWDQQIREFCAQKKITYQGFSLLTANQEVLHHPKFIAIHQRVGCTPAQLIFRFASDIGMLPLTGTTDPKHMQEDLEYSRVKLTPDDVWALESIAL